MRGEESSCSGHLRSTNEAQSSGLSVDCNKQNGDLNTSTPCRSVHVTYLLDGEGPPPLLPMGGWVLREGGARDRTLLEAVGVYVVSGLGG